MSMFFPVMAKVPILFRRMAGGQIGYSWDNEQRCVAVLSHHGKARMSLTVSIWRKLRAVARMLGELTAG
jgi:hypothetical protein